MPTRLAVLCLLGAFAFNGSDQRTETATRFYHYFKGNRVFRAWLLRLEGPERAVAELTNGEHDALIARFEREGQGTQTIGQWELNLLDPNRLALPEVGADHPDSPLQIYETQIALLVKGDTVRVLDGGKARQLELGEFLRSDDDSQVWADASHPKRIFKFPLVSHDLLAKNASRDPLSLGRTRMQDLVAHEADASRFTMATAGELFVEGGMPGLERARVRSSGRHGEFVEMDRVKTLTPARDWLASLWPPGKLGPDLQQLSEPADRARATALMIILGRWAAFKKRPPSADPVAKRASYLAEARHFVWGELELGPNWVMIDWE